jgi:PEP-CTERM motif
VKFQPITLFAAILAAVLISASSASAQTDLLTLGTTTYTIDTGGSTGPYSQTTTTLVWNGTIAFADIAYNSNDLALNLDSIPDFTIKMSLLSGAAQTIAFNIQFADSLGGPLATYTADTSLLTTIGQTVAVPLTLSGLRGNLSAISFINITWDGASAGGYNADMKSIAVPEPSTYALLALSGLAFGGYVVRRRRREQ